MNCLESDTRYILEGDYCREAILDGLYGIETPIFDRLAAETFASDAS